MKTCLKPLLASSLVVLALVLTGCNTMRGLGQDIENAGESLQNVGN